MFHPRAFDPRGVFFGVMLISSPLASGEKRIRACTHKINDCPPSLADVRFAPEADE
jgi:hypothetical protein